MIQSQVARMWVKKGTIFNSTVEIQNSNVGIGNSNVIIRIQMRLQKSRTQGRCENQRLRRAR